MENFLSPFDLFQESKKKLNNFSSTITIFLSWFWTIDISRTNHGCTPLSLPCIQLTCWTNQICPAILPLFWVLSEKSWFWSLVFSTNMAWPGHQGLAGPSPFFLELPPGGDNLRTKILKHPLGLWSAGRGRDNLRIHSISYSFRPASLSAWQNDQVQIDTLLISSSVHQCWKNWEYFDIYFEIPKLSEQTLPHQWRFVFN